MGAGAFRNTPWKVKKPPSVEQRVIEVEYTRALPTLMFSSGFDPRHPIGKAPRAEARATTATNKRRSTLICWGGVKGTLIFVSSPAYMQQLQCPLGYYWNGQMCLPINVQVQSSKFVSTLEYVLFDYIFTLTALYTFLGVISIGILWFFRESLKAAWKTRVDAPAKPVDLSTKSCNQIGAATAAALRGGNPYPLPISGEGASESLDPTLPVPPNYTSPNGSKLPGARVPRGEVY